MEQLIEKIRLQFDYIQQLKQQSKYNFIINSSSVKRQVKKLLKLKEDVVLKIEEVRVFADKLSMLEYEIVRGGNLRNIHNEIFIKTTEKQQPDIYISFEKGTPERMLYDAIFKPNRSTRDTLAVGRGGTGKTVTVCSISSRPEIQSIYPGGVFFSKLKKESNSNQIVGIISIFFEVMWKFLKCERSHENTKH